MIKCLPIAERKGPVYESNNWDGYIYIKKQNTEKQQTRKVWAHTGGVHWCDYLEQKSHRCGLEEGSTERHGESGDNGYAQYLD